MKKSLFTIGILLAISCGFLNAHGYWDEKIIYLIGENHREDKAYKDYITLLAAQGKLALGVEGLTREVSEEKAFRVGTKNRYKTSGNISIYGVEDPAFRLFQRALYLNNYLKAHDRNLDEIEAEIGKNYDLSKFNLLTFCMHKASQKFLNNFWESSFEENNPIFRYLQENKSEFLQSDSASRITHFSEQIDRWNNNDWVNFAHKVVLALKPFIMKHIAESDHKTLLTLERCFEDLKDEDNCGMNSPSFIYPISIDLRNPFIIKNLEKIYSLVKQKKPLVCILGKKHIPGVEAGLEAKGFTVLGKKELEEVLSKSEL